MSETEEPTKPEILSPNLADESKHEESLKTENNIDEKPVETAKPTIKYSEDPVELQSQLGLDPTTIVLAKVKGYRAWPAMVLDFQILPENIKNMRPKLVKQGKKQKVPLIVVPVRFFADDTYIWIKLADLKLLGRPEIDEFLAKRANAKKHDILIDAYRLAQHPPDMEEFNKWGSAGPPPDVPETTEDIFDEEDEEPPQKKLKLKISVKKPTQKTTKPKAKAATPKKTKNTEEDPGFADYEEFERELDESSTQSDPEYDSDWGVGEEDFDFETGDYLFENEDEQRQFSLEFPKARELSTSLQHYNKILLATHKLLAPMLLLEEKYNEKEVLAQLKEIDGLVSSGEVPKVAFTKSKLFRALVLTAHKPKEFFSHDKVREKIEDILARVSLSACQLTVEDLVVATPEETPAPGEPKEENGEEGENGEKEENGENGEKEGNGEVKENGEKVEISAEDLKSE